MYVEADAKLYGAGVNAGEEAVVKAAAPAEAAAGGVKCEAGNAEEVDLGRWDDGLVGARLEEIPGAGTKGGFGIAEVEFKRVAGDARETRGLAGRGGQRGEVGLGGLGSIEGHGAGGGPFRELCDLAAYFRGSGGTGFGGECGEGLAGLGSQGCFCGVGHGVKDMEGWEEWEEREEWVGARGWRGGLRNRIAPGSRRARIFGLWKNGKKFPAIPVQLPFQRGAAPRRKCAGWGCARKKDGTNAIF